MMDEPLNDHDARQLLTSILDSEDGTVHLSSHAQQRIDERHVTMRQLNVVLRHGAVDGCDLIEGSWRYHVVGLNLTAVVAFDSETMAVVVTVLD